MRPNAGKVLSLCRGAQLIARRRSCTIECMTRMLLIALLTASCAEQSQPETEPPTAVESEAPAPFGSSSDRSMMIVFTSDYCPPCQVMKPWVDEVAREHPAIDVARVNIDRSKHEQLATFLQIDKVPTLVLTSADGDVRARRESLMTKVQLVQMLQELE